MDNQQDSLDISQLRRWAMNSSLEISQFNIAQPVDHFSKTPPDQVHTLIQSDDAPAFEAAQIYLSHHIRPIEIVAPKICRARMSNGTQKSIGTQLISQSIYKDFKVEIKKSEPLRSFDATQGAVRTSDSGPISLEHDQLTRHQVDEAGLDDENDEAADATQVEIRAEMFPEADRFQYPQTPATNGRKRNSSGEVVDRSMSTPRLPVNPFANTTDHNIGVMGLSQAFHATQAPTSPFLGIPTSDGASERPSPNMYNQRPNTHLQSSSARSLYQRPATEHYAKYISKEESQEERMRHRQLIATISSPMQPSTRVPEISDISSSDELSRGNRRKARAAIRRKGKSQSGNRPATLEMGPCARSSSDRPTRKAGSQAQVLKQPPILIADGLLDVFGTDDSEEATEHEDMAEASALDSTDAQGEENKENITMQVPRTDLKGSRVLRFPSPSPVIRRRRVVAQVDLEDLTEGLPNPPQPKSQDNACKQLVAIRDSQASQQGRQSQNSAEPHTSASDPRHIIPQSQFQSTPTTSQIDPSLARRFIAPSSQQTESPLSSGRKDLGREVNGQITAAAALGAIEDVSHPSDEQRGDSNASFLPSSPPAFQRPALRSTHLEREYSGDHGAVPDFSSKGLHLTSNLESRTLPAKPARALPSGPKASAIDQTPRNSSTTLISTIPETNTFARYGGHAPISVVSIHHTTLDTDSGNKPVYENLLRMGSQTSSLFESAHTHISPATKSRSELDRVARNVAPSPLKSQSLKLRAFGEIDADPFTQDGLDDLDLDFDLITRADVDFQAEVNAIQGSSPISHNKKRRRIKVAAIPKSNGPFRATILENLQEPEISAPRNTIDQTAETRFIATSVQNSARIDGKVTSSAVESPPEVESTALHSLVASDEPGPRKSKLRAQKSKIQKQPSKIIEKLKPKIQNTKTKMQQEDGKTRPHASVKIDALNLVDASAMMNTPEPLELKSRTIVAPNRVFAMFNGTPAGHFPATCIGVTNGRQLQFHIRFDDGTLDSINHQGVRRMELKRGDVVKVDREGARTQNYVVLKMLDPQDVNSVSIATPRKAISNTAKPKVSAPSKFPATDIYGHEQVVVFRKDRFNTEEVTPHEVIKLTDIYLSGAQWSQLSERTFSYLEPPIRPNSGFDTPSDRPSTPASPSSRSRRDKSDSKLALVSARAAMASPKLFLNMVFSITNVSENRDLIVRHIEMHGGQFLESGFDHLFEPSSFELSSLDADSTGDFRLRSEAKSKGFTCLISDNFCRQQKYFQALVLGIPCLAPRWVTDCIAKKTIVPWEPYLLASGESSFLGKAICSRFLPAYPVSTANLQTMISHRPQFLQGDAVLLIVSKKTESKMQAYPFIAFALGAQHLARAANFEEAKTLLLEGEAEGRSFDWVCFHEGDRAADRFSVNDIESILFGENISREARKRRKTGELLKRKTKVVVTEFLIQSLILGALVDVD